MLALIKRTKKYIIIENDFFEILIPDSVKEYGNEVIHYSTNKLKEFLHFFKMKNYGIEITSSFFISRVTLSKLLLINLFKL